MKKSLLALVLLGACTGKKESDLAHTLRFRLPTDPPTLDWTLATDNVSHEVIILLQKGLLENDREGKAQPALAESFTVSPDGLTYTFKIRPGMFWSDGQPLVAQHFVDGFERVLNPKVASEFGYFLYPLKNAEAYLKGEIKDFAQVGVKAVDPQTLSIRLEKPLAFFPHLLCFMTTYPVRKDVIEKFGDRWTDPEHIVTAGPYVLKRFDRDSRVELEKNPNYKLVDPKTTPYPQKVVFRVVKDDATAVTLFRGGDLDIIRNVPVVQLAALSKLPEFYSAPIVRYFYFGFNLQDPAVSDPKVRKALGLAIDRKEIVQVVGPAQAQPLSSVLPPGVLGHNPLRGLQFDPVAAKKLWAQVAKKPAQIEIWHDQNEMNRLVAENIQNQWKRILGVDAHIVTQEWKVYLKTLKSNAPAFWRMGWVGDYPDPNAFLSIFTCNSTQNFSHFCNKSFDDAVEKAASINQEKERVALYEKAQKIMLEDEIAQIPLFSQSKLYLVNKRVKGFFVNLVESYKIEEVRLE